MSYNYEEELERARAIRRSRKEASMQEHSDTESHDLEEKISRAGSRRKSSGTQESFTGRSRSSRAGFESAAARIDKTGARASGGGPGKVINKKRKRIITMIIAEILALLFIFGYAAVYKIYSRPQRLEFNKDNLKSEALSVEDIKKMKGYWMIAVFGVDSRGTNVGKGSNADVNMICCINQDTGEIKLVSVFRDTYLSIDDQGSYNKINAAYANGGPEQAVKALNKNLDLNITDYITFNWKGVADAINILGGVDLELSKAEFRYINSFITETVKSTNIGSHHLKSAGMNHLDGVQAVAYGRLRLMDTDYARTERQRKIINLAFEKAKKADYSVLNNILVVVLPQVATSLDFADLTNVALNITKYNLGETTGFPMARGEANIKGSCVVPATLEYNVKLLHEFFFADEIYTPTDTVKNISAKIASNTGIYKEGQVINRVSTEGVLPKETKVPETAEATSEEMETTKAEETDEFGDIIETSTKETSKYYPGIGETDESGNLIDGPEDIDITEGTVGPGSKPGILPPPTTSPVRPGESTTSPNEGSGPGVPSTESTAAVRPGESTQEQSTAPVRPGDIIPETTTAASPGGNLGENSGDSSGPGKVISSKGPGE